MWPEVPCEYKQGFLFTPYSYLQWKFIEVEDVTLPGRIVCIVSISIFGRFYSDSVYFLVWVRGLFWDYIWVIVFAFASYVHVLGKNLFKDLVSLSQNMYLLSLHYTDINLHTHASQRERGEERGKGDTEERRKRQREMLLYDKNVWDTVMFFLVFMY